MRDRETSVSSSPILVLTLFPKEQRQGAHPNVLPLLKAPESDKTASRMELRACRPGILAAPKHPSACVTGYSLSVTLARH